MNKFRSRIQMKKNGTTEQENSVTDVLAYCSLHTSHHFCCFHLITEMAMLLPASFGASRRMNDSHDIRKNLRYRNAELAQEHPEGSTNV